MLRQLDLKCCFFVIVVVLKKKTHLNSVLLSFFLFHTIPRGKHFSISLNVSLFCVFSRSST